MKKPLKYKVVTTLPDENGDPAEATLAVVPPSAAVKQKARLVHGKAYREAVEAKLLIRQQLDNHLREMDLWDDARQAEFERLTRSINEGERKLAAGGIPLAEGRKLAIRMSRDRAALRNLVSARSEIEAVTADAVAEQAQFNYYVAACTVYDTGGREGRPVFTKDGVNPSLEDYVERGTEPAAFDAAAKVSEVLYGSAAEILAELPENKFLKTYKLVDADWNLVDRDGHRVDEQGRRVNDDGYLIDADGNPVDAEGNRLDADGNYVVAFAPFTDDDGNPIVLDPPQGDLPLPPESDPEE